ncbi:hypothetical protein NDI37_26255 [Funiculus sociatus GB2-A5]|uniref:Uncharacterized protein n=1 Tax=Funiculus sociatus GB2-A5 TaxID=2933946 RepID=A0ABV0JWV7_9CYAN|nr:MULTISPECIES: hypothetical protein [unclassified Trichocoleus]MBD1906057.1 hypothetical protein [Trichocoleus sp. FACHB-832]MBD2062377.1 hypothetical protein [Trichocoleus sp. FACHB-6]
MLPPVKLPVAYYSTKLTKVYSPLPLATDVPLAGDRFCPKVKKRRPGETSLKDEKK